MSQLPPPSNLPGPKRTGPPPRVVGGKPGSQPGPPRPKPPTPFGGKPMMPITSLIQAPAFSDPEGGSNAEEKTKNEEIQSGNKLQGARIEEKIEDDVKEAKDSNDEVKKVESAKLQEDDELFQGKRENYMNGLLIDQSKKVDVEDIQPAVIHQDAEIKREISSPYKTASKAVVEDHHDIKANRHESEDRPKDSSNLEADPTEEKPPMFGLSGPFRKEPKATDDFEDNHRELPPAKKGEKSKSVPQGGPFSKAKQAPFSNSRQYEVKEEEDQEDTRDGDQNPSPVVQMGESSGKPERISSQEDQRDSETYEKPPMPVFFKPKNPVKHENIIESTNDIIHRHTDKELEHEKEDVSLAMKLKALEVELEKERREKAALVADQTRLLEENASLKEELLEATSKTASHSEPKANTKDQDLLSKDEEIKRLKSELKSMMEGSRLVTEHSNQVISESTKFKEEAETMISALEQEKEELHQKFVAYKKQVHEEYTSKIVALQEKEKYLSEKVAEYEKDLNRHQGDLNQRAQTINKLAFINNEVGSAMSQWPAFTELLTQIHAHSKLIEESRFQIPSPVKASSPIKVQHSPIKPKEVLSASHQDHVQFEDIEVESKDHNVAEVRYHSEQNSPFIHNATENKQYLDIPVPRKSEKDDKISSTPETHAEDTSQEKTEEVHNKPELEPFQNPDPVETIDNGWGIEEPPLEVDEKQEEQQYEQPAEQEKAEDKVDVELIQDSEQVEPLDNNGWGAEEPLVEDQKQEEQQYEAPVEQGDVVDIGFGEGAEQVQPLDNGWGVEEPLIEDQKQEEQPYEMPIEHKAEDRVDIGFGHAGEQVEPLNNEWGIEETPLVENEKQENLEINAEYEEPAQKDKFEDNIQVEPVQEPETVEPLDNGWGVEEPLIEDQKQEEQQYEAPIVQENADDRVDIGLGQDTEQVEPLDNGWGVEEPVIEDQTQEEQQYGVSIGQEKVDDRVDIGFGQDAEQVEPLDNGWGIEETPVVEEEKQTNQEAHYHYQAPVEYQAEEQAAYQQEPLEYREEAPPALEMHSHEPPVAVNYQDGSHEQGGYYDEAGYQQTSHDQNEQAPRNEIETVSSSQLTAVPTYRMPQKKKKGQPAKKPVVGFRPASTAYSMPDQPQTLGTEEESQNAYETQHTDTQVTHHEEARPYEHVQQDPEMMQAGPGANDNNTYEAEPKPPQFVPFGRTPLTQAKKGPGKAQPKAGLPRPNVFGQARVPQYQYPQDNGAYQESSVQPGGIDMMETPPVYRQPAAEENPEEPVIYNAEGNNEALSREESDPKNDINGHSEAPPTQGKKIKSNKIIKKKQPATGSIFS